MASIRKRTLPSGKTVWLCDFMDANGRRRARQYKTRREADAFLVSARASVADGSYVHNYDSVAVADAAQAWLHACALRRDARRRMEPTTWTTYEGHVRLHICDGDIGIGRIKLPRLKRKSVNAFRDRLLATGRSETTTRKVLSSLGQIVKHAQDEGWIAHNPVQGVRVLRRSRIGNAVSIPSKDEIRHLIDDAPDCFRPYLLTAVLCGLRASEQRAIRWQDVDFDAGMLHIRRRADARGNIGEPKSAAGRRSVPMGPMVGNVLKTWRLRAPPSSEAWVFPTKRGTVQSHANILHRWFYPLRRELGLKLRWHDLRHFAVSLWIEQGFSPKAIMEFAGHSSITMTYDRYGHLLPSPDHREGMAQVERRLFS